jgi:hypothetical protein
MTARPSPQNPASLKHLFDLRKPALRIVNCIILHGLSNCIPVFNRHQKNCRCDSYRTVATPSHVSTINKSTVTTLLHM